MKQKTYKELFRIGDLVEVAQEPRDGDGVVRWLPGQVAEVSAQLHVDHGGPGRATYEIAALDHGRVRKRAKPSPVVYSYQCEPATWDDERVLTEQVRLATEYGRELSRIENLARALWRSHARLTADLAPQARALRDDPDRHRSTKDEVADAHPDEPAASLSARLGISPELAQSMVGQREIVRYQARAVSDARAVFVAQGLYWGSYQHADEAHSASVRSTPSNDDVAVFRGPTSAGCAAVHLQPARPLQANDAWIRIGELVRHQSPYRRDHRDDGGVNRSGRPRPAKHHEVKLRVGTVEGGGRLPKFTTIHVAVHRPLPPGSVVSWAHVKRRVVGTRVRWQFMITARVDRALADAADDLGRAERAPGRADLRDDPDDLSRAERAPGRPGRGPAWSSRDPRAQRVGVDVGWRQMGDRVRVAYWWGSDGRHGEVAIPNRVLGADEKADSLRAIRDRNFNEVRGRLQAWIGQLEDRDLWIVDAGRGVHSWLKKVHLVNLLTRWRAERLPGDGAAFDDVAAWFKQDRHLWDWEAASREKRRRRVLEIIRVAAIQLVRAYDAVGVREAAVAKIVRRPAKSTCEACVAAGRRCPACRDAERTRRIAATRVPHACPALVLQELERAGRSYQSDVTRINRSVEARACTRCGDPRGAVQDWMPLVVACPSCAFVEDQDVTASQNLCRMTETAGPRAKATKKLGPRRTRRAAAKAAEDDDVDRDDEHAISAE